MDFGALKKYAVFSGRASRKEYWHFILLYIVWMFVFILIPSFSETIYIIGFVGLIIPGIAVSVRRLHDIDRSGWWYLLIIVPIASLILIYWACKKGTDGENEFGSDPLDV